MTDERSSTRMAANNSTAGLRSSTCAAALTWAPYAASVWSVLFAFVSFYWAAGGMLGVATLGSAIQVQVHDPTFIAIVWLTGYVKLAAGLGALTLARPWLLWVPRVLKLTAAYTGGIGLALYGAIPFAVAGLVFAGLIHPSGVVDWNGLRWHFLLWDPWWLLGGVLFVLAGRHYQVTAPRTIHPR